MTAYSRSFVQAYFDSLVDLLRSFHAGMNKLLTAPLEGAQKAGKYAASRSVRGRHRLLHGAHRMLRVACCVLRVRSMLLHVARA